MVGAGMKMGRRFAIAFLAAMLVAVVSACAGQDSKNLPQINPSAKSHPKLDSQLNQLVSAEMSGNAASFARQNNIGLFDGSVRVIIEVLPGQLEAASRAVNGVGGKVETSSDDLLQASVPVNSLTALADSAAIRFVRLPMPVLPGS